MVTGSDIRRPARRCAVAAAAGEFSERCWPSFPGRIGASPSHCRDSSRSLVQRTDQQHLGAEQGREADRNTVSLAPAAAQSHHTDAPTEALLPEKRSVGPPADRSLMSGRSRRAADNHRSKRACKLDPVANRLVPDAQLRALLPGDPLLVITREQDAPRLSHCLIEDDALGRPRQGLGRMDVLPSNSMRASPLSAAQHRRLGNRARALVAAAREASQACRRDHCCPPAQRARERASPKAPLGLPCPACHHPDAAMLCNHEECAGCR